MSIKIGDVDQNGEINVIDVVQLIDAILTQRSYVSTLDVNTDNQVNIMDAVLLVQQILAPPSVPFDVICDQTNAEQLLHDHYVDQTLVRFVTNLSDPEDATNFLSVDVALYDPITPSTVTNFLSYVNADQYDGIFVHRSLPNFVVQTGGFTFDGASPLAVDTYPPVINEYYYSNLVGTLAMAKLGGDPDSATSQFFFNLADNSANLDNQNGGFTVFGEVIGNGMSVINSIANLNTHDLDGGAASLYNNVPLIDESLPTLENNLVTFTEVSVITAEQHCVWLEQNLDDSVPYIEELTGQVVDYEGDDEDFFG